MPKRYRKKRGGRRKKSYRRSYKKGGMKKLIKKTIANMAEKKYSDSRTQLGASNSASIAQWFASGQGVGELQHIGDQVKYYSHQTRYQWIAADTTNLCRIILFRWHPDSTVVAPLPAQILQFPSGLNSVLSPYVDDERGLFTVVFDKTTQLSQTGDDAKMTKITGKLSGTVSFNGTSNINGTNMLFILLVSDSNVIPDPVINIYTRIRYTDT